MPPFQSRSTGARSTARISSFGVTVSGLDAERGARLRRELDRLRGARIDAAAPRDQAGVVVGPGRARQAEEPLALGEARRRIRIGVDEDVAVVERPDHLQVPRAEHAVAEHVARHVADPDDGDLGGVRVDAEIAEVPLHRLPRAARGDPHLLVVVAVPSRPTRTHRRARSRTPPTARSRCPRTSPSPCRRRPPGTGRRRRGARRPAAERPRRRRSCR